LPPPAYFAQNARLNKHGVEDFQNVKLRATQPLTPAAFRAAAEGHEALILDTRKPQEFAAAHIPGSIFIGLDGQFAPWVGALIPDLGQPLLLVVEPGREDEAIMRLTRVGYDNIIGFLNGGFAAWPNAGFDTDKIESISADAFAERFLQGNIRVIDVRKPGEFSSEHVDKAESFPLDFINSWTESLRSADTFHLHCAGGYRSIIAASILKSRGIHQLVDVAGGYAAISKTAVPRTDYVCPSTLK
jgi:rhodanese-related sulfurtransferase